MLREGLGWATSEPQHVQASSLGFLALLLPPLVLRPDLQQDSLLGWGPAVTKGYASWL